MRISPDFVHLFLQLVRIEYLWEWNLCQAFVINLRVFDGDRSWFRIEVEFHSDERDTLEDIFSYYPNLVRSSFSQIDASETIMEIQGRLELFLEQDMPEFFRAHPLPHVPELNE